MTNVLVGNATYTITFTGSPSGGTYTLKVGDEVCDAVAYNANAAAIELEIEQNANVVVGEASTTGTSPITTVFSGSMATTPLVLAVSDDSITGGTVVVTQIVDGTDTVLGLWDNCATQLATQYSDANTEERAQTAIEEKLLDLAMAISNEIR